jgi:hypothetical protein
MEYAIKKYEDEKKQVEHMLREQNLMQKDMKLATVYLKNIRGIKRAMRKLNKNQIINRCL